MQNGVSKDSRNWEKAHRCLDKENPAVFGSSARGSEAKQQKSKEVATSVESPGINTNIDHYLKSFTRTELLTNRC